MRTAHGKAYKSFSAPSPAADRRFPPGPTAAQRRVSLQIQGDSAHNSRIRQASIYTKQLVLYTPRLFRLWMKENIAFYITSDIYDEQQSRNKNTPFTFFKCLYPSGNNTIPWVRLLHSFIVNWYTVTMSYTYPIGYGSSSSSIVI